MLYTYLLSFGITVKMADLLSVISTAQSPTCTICCECHICHECQFHISTFWLQNVGPGGDKNEQKKLFSYQQSVLLLTNQAARFISHGIGCSYFSRNFLLSILLWYDLRFYSNQGRGHIFMSSNVCQHLTEVFFLTEN